MAVSVALLLAAAAFGVPSRSFFASTLQGLEGVLAAELQQLGAAAVVEGRLGVHFEGSTEVGARAVLWCRSAMRVMELLHEQTGVTTQHELYQMCREVRWEELLLTEHQTLSVSTVLSLDRAMSSGRMRPGDWICPRCSSLVFATKDECFSCGAPRDTDVLAGARRRLGHQVGSGATKGSEPLTHSHFSALTVKNAACDVLREKRGWRPSVDKEDADLPLWLHVHRGDARLYRVLSGPGSLHRRGYREGERVHKAAMKETLAAAVLLYAGYDGSQALCDPMCGSGTIAIEAALIATNTAPGLLRSTLPPLMRWTDTGYLAAWRDAVEAAEAERIPAAPRAIMANEIHGGALALARRAAHAAGVERDILFSHRCAGDYSPPEVPQLVVCNPPWGLRLDEEASSESWAILGEFLKRECRAEGTEAWLVSGNRDLTRNLRLRARSRHPVEQAGDSLRIICYDMGPPTERKRENANTAGLDHADGGEAIALAPHAQVEQAAKAHVTIARTQPTRPPSPQKRHPSRSASANRTTPPHKVVLDGTGLSGADLDAAFAELYD